MTTTLRLATVGTRVDGLRSLLTAFGAALAVLSMLSAATVVAIGPGDGPYTSDLLNQGGLHPGVVIALVALCVPVLVLLAQCSRIGAPARDRRLAALRLAGATPRDTARTVALEAGLSAGVGAALGTGAYFLLRVLLDERIPGAYNSYRDSNFDEPGPGASVAYRLPTDVLPPSWVIAALAVAVPLLVTVATTVALRRVAFTPFGVTRRHRTRPPRVVPLVLTGVGIAVFFALAALLQAQAITGTPAFALSITGFLLTAVGLLSGQAALVAFVGRVLVERTSRPALLLAARRMIADPFAFTRSTAVLTVAVLVAAGARHLRNATVASQGSSSDPFYTRAYDLVDATIAVGGALAALGLLIAAAEGVVARRRTYAAVVAAGTPRAVVARAVVAETMLPLIPSLLLATIAGTVAAMGFLGRTTMRWDDATQRNVTTVIPVGWTALAVTLAIAVVATAFATAAGLVFLRSATDVGELRTAA